MSRRADRRRRGTPASDVFDLAGTDPELLHSGRIPDPQPAHTPLFRWLAGVLSALEAFLRARGGTSLRFGIRFLWGLVAAVGLFLLFGPIINKPLDFDEVIESAKVSEVDWVARDAKIDYTVERDEGGGFAALVSERYTANFLNGPESGVERAFVTEFHGHDTRFELRSATVDGEPAEADVRRGATVTHVTVSNPDGSKLEGEREIELRYEMHDLVSTETDEATGRQVDDWSWPLLGPSWPQATKGVEVSLTLAPELDDALVRQPQAYVGWLLLSGTEWLTPEERTAEGVRYSFSNDDTLPPHASLFIGASFEPGTFEQPPTTPLFWLQTWGPLLPLALLAVFLLCALAARRVVWADSAGDPWYLARAEPPDDLTALEAAQLLDRPWHTELISELDRAPGRPRRGERRKPADTGGRAREAWLASVARAGMRAGRIGTFPSASAQREAWAKRDLPVEKKLRWVPDSYLRDTFVYGSLAIALLQWGLLRQLSQQVILTVVWWPALFVLVSTVLALLSVWAVRRPRPLTRAGALAVQQLKGIDAYARSTRLLDRGPVDEPLLPYALLFERARKAGRRVAEHAGREGGDRWLGRGWRTERFVSMPAMLALVLAVVALAASIFTVSTRPAPYAEADFVTWPSSLPGTVWSQVEGFEVDAELGRDDAGGAQLDVVERDAVRFTAGGSSVPQFAREWPRERLGQDLGLEVEAVRVDGEDVPFREISGPQSLAMITQMSGVLDGLHDVEVRYALTAPVVEASAGSGVLQQLRWTAWYDFWEDTYYTDTADLSQGSAPVRPLSVRLTVAPELAGEIRSGGWVDSDSDRARVPYENGNWYQPWVYDNSVYLSVDLYPDRRYELRIGDEETREDGALVVTLDADAVESRQAEDYAEGTPAGPWQVSDEIDAGLEKYELDLSGDLGAVLNFADGTFADVETGAYGRYRLASDLPYALVLGFAGTIAALSIGVFAFARRMRRPSSASLRLVSFAAIPIAAVAQCVLFFWGVMSMAGSDNRPWAAIGIGAVMLAAVVAQAIAVGLRAPGRRKTSSSKR